MKTLDLSSKTDSLAAMTDRKRPSPTSVMDLPDLEAELRRRAAQVQETISKLNLELEHLSEDITNLTSSAVSTNKPIETILDHSLVPQSQPIDIQYPIASRGIMGHMQAVEMLPSYGEATTSSPVDSDLQPLDATYADSQGRSIGISTEDSATAQEKSRQQDIVQFVTALSRKKTFNPQNVAEASPAVVLQFQAFHELFKYANAKTERDRLKRPQIQNELMTLQMLTEALGDGNTFQSDATSLIASTLSCLIESITVEAEQGPTEYCSSTLKVVDDLNETLQEWYNWDPEKDQFSSPFDVTDLHDVLTFFTLALSLNINANHDECNGVYETDACDVFGLKLKEPLSINQILLASFNLRRLERGHCQPQPSQEEMDDTMLEPKQSTSDQRSCADTIMTYMPQDDPVDFLWSDPEDDDNEDNEQYDETDESDTETVDGIFDSATEISGADVTENDWSEIDRESD
ncbi:hypothetical protein INT44_003065 [Umbelopsis vinacea]|uniref:Uncharacterized protein n=1 Tax=Umbelopsis vinacea TaxID=44442 RepID=A0A8H7Q5F0_9FUNG|nr:hypothetical protein INT44_003065 [Umbelopsis vinacea]